MLESTQPVTICHLGIEACAICIAQGQRGSCAASPPPYRSALITECLLRRWRGLLRHARHLLLPLLVIRLAPVLRLGRLRLALLGVSRDLLAAAELVIAAATLRAGSGVGLLLVHPSRPLASMSGGILRP